MRWKTNPFIFFWLNYVQCLEESSQAGTWQAMFISSSGFSLISVIDQRYSSWCGWHWCNFCAIFPLEVCTVGLFFSAHCLCFLHCPFVQPVSSRNCSHRLCVITRQPTAIPCTVDLLIVLGTFSILFDCSLITFSNSTLAIHIILRPLPWNCISEVMDALQ